MKRRLGTIAVLILGFYASFHSSAIWPSSFPENLRPEREETIEYSRMAGALRSPRRVMQDSVRDTATIETALALATALAIRQATEK